MYNGIVENISELFRELSKIENLKNKITFNNEKIVIVFYDEFKLEIVFETKLGIYNIYINSMHYCEIEDQDIYKFIMEIINESIIIQNKKLSPFKRLFTVKLKKTFNLKIWENKRNIKIFTSDKILVDNF